MQPAGVSKSLTRSVSMAESIVFEINGSPLECECLCLDSKSAVDT